MTDRDCFGLRGPAKLCESHRTWYLRGCGPEACETEERSDVTVVKFRQDGSLQRQWHADPRPNSSEWAMFYEYRDGNQLSEVREERGGTVTRTRLYEYDSAGRISRIVVRDKDGNQQVAETYAYEAVAKRRQSCT